MARKSSDFHSSGVGVIGFNFIALVITVCTGIFLNQTLKSKNIDVTPKRTIVVAARDIKASTKLKKSFFKEVRVPLEAVPENHYTSVNQIFSELTYQAVLVRDTYKNEVLLRSRVSDPRRGTGFASLIDKGWRALSLEVDSRITRANVVYPGARVDILATLRSKKTRVPMTRQQAEDIEILAVNGIFDPVQLREHMRKSKKRARTDVLTVRVKASQAERIILASHEGKIDVVLRNTGGVTRSDAKVKPAPNL
jgi:Flp pilus assembly protein CpaB